MPTTAPPPTPITLGAGSLLRFDDAVAAVLQATLEALADEAAGQARNISQLAEIARTDWAGHTRSWFDVRADQLVCQARAAAATARSEAGAVAQTRAWAASVAGTGS